MTWRVALPRASPRSNDGTASVGYDAAGNIASRNGSYSYSPGTHRLSSGGGNAYANYDLNGNVDLISNASGTRTLAYTAFNLPASVTGTSGYGSTSYLYDGSHARIREVSSGAAASGTTYYLGGFEAHRRTDGVLELRHYLATPEGVVGIYTQRSNGVNDLRYWHKDHLGSVQVIADNTGVVKQGFLFDAWGNRTTRSLAGGEAYAEERSYTGHELLTEIALVHMNGRIYDPVTGRFLQADPLVQDPFNGQSYNRYGYVLNNPLVFTDPSGFSWWTQWRRPIFAIAAAAATLEFGGELAWSIIAAEGPPTGAAVAGANAFVAAAAGFAAGGIQGGNIESALQGALFAELNFGIGQLTTGATGFSLFGQDAFAANVGLHAAVGCGQQAAAGGSCKGGALAGGFSALAGPFVPGPGPVQFAAHIAIGGFASKLAGDKFENGAITAAFDYLFNCMAHECLAHYVAGSGRPLPAYFSELDAENVRPEQFRQVQSLLSSQPPDGTYTISDEMGWTTKSANASAAYGRVVLSLNGTLTIANGNYTMEGTLAARPDLYDFDKQPWGVRTIPGEVSTRFGSLLPGTPFYNYFLGSRELYSHAPLPRIP